MNQDFMLTGSAAIARKLMRLSRIATMHLDPEIIALAKTNLLNETDFKPFPNLSVRECKAIQNIVDHDFRAVLPGQGHRQREIAIIAAKIAGVSPIIVVGADPHAFHAWNKIAKRVGVEMIFLPYQFKSEAPDPDLVRGKRDGLLILEEVSVHNGVEAMLYPNDFPRTIILSHRIEITEMSDCVLRLFPKAPIDLLSHNKNAMFRMELSRKGFRSSEPKHLAFLLNVVVDLIGNDNPNFPINPRSI